MRARRAMSWLLGVLLAAPLVAQDEVVTRIEVRVTSTAGSVVYLDRGKDAGIEPGDAVRLYPLGGDVTSGRIRAVADRSSEATVLTGDAQIETGTLGEVLVPSDRLAERDAQARERLEWEYEEGEWTDDMPLLARAQGKKPAERDPLFSGRVYSVLDYIGDSQDADQEDLYARLGADLRYENPFQRGGVLHLDVEGIQRSTDIDGESVEDESDLRIDRFSYSQGGTRGTPHFWQAGRFLSSEFSELGVNDGFEYVHRRQSGHRFGASLGYLPEPDADFETGDDLQTSVFYRAVRGEREELSLGAAYQKTWHDGDSDRDLFLANLRWYPASGWNANATAWVDVYGSEDEQKSSGPELTQLHTNVGHRWDGGHGMTLGYSKTRFPELLRDEIYSDADDSIYDSETDRLSASGWVKATQDVRLYGRVDSWSDEEDQDGGGGELRVDWTDLVVDRSRVSAAVFQNDGEFNSVLGTRLSFQRFTSTGFWELFYEIADYEQDDFDGDQEELTQHRLRGSWDVSTSSAWSFSLYAENRFGDEQDSVSAGFYLQRSF